MKKQSCGLTLKTLFNIVEKQLKLDLIRLRAVDGYASDITR